MGVRVRNAKKVCTYKYLFVRNRGPEVIVNSLSLSLL